MRRSKIHPTLGYREGCGGYDWMMSGAAESKLNPMINAGLCEVSGANFQGSESVNPIHADLIQPVRRDTMGSLST